MYCYCHTSYIIPCFIFQYQDASSPIATPTEGTRLLVITMQIFNIFVFICVVLEYVRMSMIIIICFFVCTHILSCVCVYIYVCTYEYMYNLCMCVCVCVCTCVCLYMYNIYMHVRLFMYNYVCMKIILLLIPIKLYLNKCDIVMYSRILCYGWF